MAWQKNYFIFDHIGKATCELCCESVKTNLVPVKVLINHIMNPKHIKTFTNNKNVLRNLNWQTVDWDLYYKLDVLDGKITCIYCKKSPKFYDELSKPIEITQYVSTQMTDHLKYKHGVRKEEWEELKKLLKNRKEKDFVVVGEIIKGTECECTHKYPLHQNAISLVKHLINKHKAIEFSEIAHINL